MTTSRQHVQGAIKMVELNGGAKGFGLSAFLASVLQNFIANKDVFEDKLDQNEAFP